MLTDPSKMRRRQGYQLPLTGKAKEHDKALEAARMMTVMIVQQLISSCWPFKVKCIYQAASEQRVSKSFYRHSNISSLSDQNIKERCN